MDLRLDDGVAIIKMTSAPANALSYDLIAELDDSLTAALADGAKALVFCSGLERFFAAGADLKMLANATQDDFGHYLVTLRSFIERLANLSEPSIAVIDGMALGGGLELALACTFRTASASAMLGVPEVKLGLMPGAGGTQRLPQLIGRGPAIDLLLGGHSVDGTQAKALGLIDHLHPSAELVDRAIELAQLLANGPKQAIAAIVRCVDASSDLPLADGLAVEADEVQRLFNTKDAREGIAAFIDKRQASFKWGD